MLQTLHPLSCPDFTCREAQFISADVTRRSKLVTTINQSLEWRMQENRWRSPREWKRGMKALSPVRAVWQVVGGLFMPYLYSTSVVSACRLMAHHSLWLLFPFFLHVRRNFMQLYKTDDKLSFQQSQRHAQSSAISENHSFLLVEWYIKPWKSMFCHAPLFLIQMCSSFFIITGRHVTTDTAWPTAAFSIPWLLHISGQCTKANVPTWLPKVYVTLTKIKTNTTQRCFGTQPMRLNVGKGQWCWVKFGTKQ